MKKNFSAANLILTKECNMACPYCFVHKTNEIMSEEVIEKTVQFLINGAFKNGDSYFYLGLFGGEPTLTIHNMNYILDYAYTYADKFQIENNVYIEPRFSLTTNGMNMSDDVLNFLLKWKDKAKQINVQLSYDGTPDIETQARPLKNSSVLSGNIMQENLIKLKNFIADNNLNKMEEIGIHSVITKQTLPYLFDIYKYFHKLEFPIWHYLLPEEQWTQKDEEIYMEQLTLIRDYFFENDLIYLAACSSFQINHPDCGPACLAGNSFCGIAPNGDIYPCHRMIDGNPSAKLGNVNDGIIDLNKKAIYEELDRKDFIGLTTCGDCEAIKSCYTCIAANIEHNILPNLCFPKNCAMTLIQHKFNKQIEEYLIKNNIIKGQRDMVNTELNGDINILYQDLDTIKESFTKLVDGIAENNSIIGQALDEITLEIEDIRAKQLDILNLLVAVLSNDIS